jgi:peptidoglycan-associated lipoprotein
MKFKKLTQILLVSCGILALGACSSTKHGYNSGADGASAMNDMNMNGAQSSGIGDNENYGGGGQGGSKNSKTARVFYFDYDKFDVRTDDKAAVLANADWLIAHPNSKIILEGHTDPRGSREYNVGLGENRAKAVLDLLQSRGVNPDQIRVVSYGAERPAAQGHTEQDFQLDRRAVIDVAQR